MSSDEDQPIVMDLLVGFNFSDELVIVIDFFDYEEPPTTVRPPQLSIPTMPA